MAKEKNDENDIPEMELDNKYSDKKNLIRSPVKKILTKLKRI
jgi:hypothetical protein